jgi:hypothetical protein
MDDATPSTADSAPNRNITLPMAPPANRQPPNGLSVVTAKLVPPLNTSADVHGKPGTGLVVSGSGKGVSGYLIDDTTQDSSNSIREDNTSFNGAASPETPSTAVNQFTQEAGTPKRRGSHPGARRRSISYPTFKQTFERRARRSFAIKQRIRSMWEDIKKKMRRIPRPGARRRTGRTVRNLRSRKHSSAEIKGLRVDYAAYDISQTSLQPIISFSTTASPFDQLSETSCQV